MRRWIFAVFSVILIAFSANATVNDGHVTTTVGYVTHELDTRQDEFPAQSGTKAMTFGDDAGEIGARTVTSTLGSSTSDDSLPTVSAVNTGLGTKQKAITAKNTNTVLTYTGTAGNVGAKGIYQDSGTYASQMDNLVTAGTFNAALRNGLESEFVCAETDPSNGQCWAWSINNNGGPWNYFYMDNILAITQGAGSITHNADGSITVTTRPTSSGQSSFKTLRQLAPGLEAGKSYKISINTTGSSKFIYLISVPTDDGPINIQWLNGTILKITAGMLDSLVALYASGPGTTATISEIKITAVESGTPVGASGTILPAGYTPLEYIQSSGAQYISTGIAPTANFDIHLDGMLINNTSKRPIFSTTTGSVVVNVSYADTNRLFASTINEDNAYGGIAYGGVGNRFHIALSPHRLLHYTGQERILERPYTPSGNLVFGDVNGSGVQMRIYGTKLYDGTTLTFQGIPARRNSDGAVGLYDAVNSRFLANSGTGNFTAGPDANNNLYLPQNQ